MEESKYINVKDMSIHGERVERRFIIPQYEIVQTFSEVQSKAEIVDNFLGFSRHCFSNLALFSVYSKSIQFLKGMGDNLKDPPYVGSLGIDKNTVIRRVVMNKFPYRGPVPVGSDEKVIFSKYFNSYPEEVFIYPGSIRGEETDILFYANDFQQNRESSLVTFEYIIEKATLAFRYLWVQKQLATI